MMTGNQRVTKQDNRLGGGRRLENGNGNDDGKAEMEEEAINKG